MSRGLYVVAGTTVPHAQPPHPARRAAARVLQAMGRTMTRTAARLLDRPARAKSPQKLREYEAPYGGAVYGAIYEDGELVGWIEGVNRL
jgi:hypothetical protein